MICSLASIPLPNRLGIGTEIGIEIEIEVEAESMMECLLQPRSVTPGLERVMINQIGISCPDMHSWSGRELRTVAALHVVVGGDVLGVVPDGVAGGGPLEAV